MVCSVVRDERGFGSEVKGAQMGGLCHQDMVIHEQHMAIRVGGIRVSAQKKLGCAAIYRANVQLVVGMANVVVIGGVVEKMFAIGEEKGPTVRDGLWVGSGVGGNRQ